MAQQVLSLGQQLISQSIQITPLQIEGSWVQYNQLKLLSKTYGKEKFCDATIIVGSEKKEFEVNRLLLAASSGHFEAALYDCKFDGTLVLPEDSADVFECVVRFCYNMDPDITMEHVIDVVQSADKFQIDNLVEWGMELLAGYLDDNNLAIFFNEAVNKNQAHCIDICREYICDKEYNCHKIFESDGFYSMSTAAVQELIKMNEVAVDEQNLFNYLVKWAENTSAGMEDDLDADAKHDGGDKKAKLPAVCSLVRFGLMSNEFITQKVVPEGVLSFEDISKIFLFINGRGKCGRFITTKRRRPNMTRGEWLKSLEVGMELEAEFDGRLRSLGRVIYVDRFMARIRITSGPFCGRTKDYKFKPSH